MSVLSYCPTTETIRTFPEGLLVSYWSYRDNRWIVDADRHVPLKVVLHVQTVLHTHDTARWLKGLPLLNELTPFEF